MGISFISKSILMGVGLAADAFSVSVADGLHWPHMKKPRGVLLTGAFGIFQFLMPLSGWFLVHTLQDVFYQIQPFIPWTGLALLVFIGCSMINDGLAKMKKSGVKDESAPPVSDAGDIAVREILVQAVATSIDALSVGFVIAAYSLIEAFVSTFIIGVVTFIVSLSGLYIGKIFGAGWTSKADILGGVILIMIGISLVA